MRNIEDQDLHERLQLAQEKIVRLEREIEDLNDLRMTLARILNREQFHVYSQAMSRLETKKSPADRRAEMTRLWAAERDKP